MPSLYDALYYKNYYFLYRILYEKIKPHLEKVKMQYCFVDINYMHKFGGNLKIGRIYEKTFETIGIRYIIHEYFTG